jgi:hypothetical protein
MAAFLRQCLFVSTVEGGNFNLALADGGVLPVQTTVGGGGGSVTATLPLATSGGGTGKHCFTGYDCIGGVCTANVCGP